MLLYPRKGHVFHRRLEWCKELRLCRIVLLLSLILLSQALLGFPGQPVALGGWHGVRPRLSGLRSSLSVEVWIV